ncbi:MAG TPA: ribonucleoside-triphosphate reductase, partial [Patescibacteria group bacterium]|nr:ribonucleoside-triphosphate reductase [Patescibacteria group bacterium]
VNQSSSVTCVKPSGTVSQLTDCASGMHARYAPYYIRRVRISATDSLFKMLKDQGVPYKPEVGQSYENATTFVFEFPVKAPKGSIFSHDLSALDQLKHWKSVKLNYTEHNPSVTISVGENEWIEVANWVYDNWDIVGGLSFLPRLNHVYELAPYEEINKDRYEELLTKFKGMDFAQIVVYEKNDETEAKKELACAGGACEL